MKSEIDFLEDPEFPEQKIEKISSISYDGSQYLVRIPKKIADFLQIKNNKKVKFKVNVPHVVITGKKYILMEIRRNDKNRSRTK